MNNKVSSLPSWFMISIPVLFAISKLFVGCDSIDIIYLSLVVLLIVKHYFITKKGK